MYTVYKAGHNQPTITVAIHETQSPSKHYSQKKTSRNIIQTQVMDLNRLRVSGGVNIEWWKLRLFYLEPNN